MKVCENSDNGNCKLKGLCICNLSKPLKKRKRGERAEFNGGRSFFSWLWNCRIWNFHKWTCHHEQGINPTKEQLKNGIKGFYDYAKMYCEICGVESKLSKQIRCKFKK